MRGRRGQLALYLREAISEPGPLNGGQVNHARPSFVNPGMDGLLRQGEHVLKYRLRAEVPGKFHALPTKGWAMYAPEIKAISDEMRLGIED